MFGDGGLLEAVGISLKASELELNKRPASPFALWIN